MRYLLLPAFVLSMVFSSLAYADAAREEDMEQSHQERTEHEERSTKLDGSLSGEEKLRKLRGL